MKYLTGNPLGSTDVRDLLDNAIGLDDALNDVTNNTWTDRFGRVRKTLKGYDAAFEEDQAARTVAFNSAQAARAASFQVFLDASGWSSLGNYAAGISIVSHSQVVEYQGQPYALKSTVPASVTTPYVTTGNWATESVNFKLVGDSTLRQDLSGVLGALMVGGSTLSVNSIAEVATFSATWPQGMRLDVATYHPGSMALSDPSFIGGGAKLVYMPAVPRSKHNGGTIFSPTCVWNGSTLTHAAFLTGSGDTAPSANGCWVNLESGDVNLQTFGGQRDGSMDNRYVIEAAAKLRRPLYAPAGRWKTSPVTLTSDLLGCKLRGDGFSHYFDTRPTVFEPMAAQSHIFAIGNGCDNFTFQDLRIDGKALANINVDASYGAFLTYENVGNYRSLTYGHKGRQGETKVNKVFSGGHAGVGYEIYSDAAVTNSAFSNGTECLRLVAGGNRLSDVWVNSGSVSCMTITPLNVNTTLINTSITNLYIGETYAGATLAPILKIAGDPNQRIQQLQLTNSHFVSADGQASKLNVAIALSHATDVVINNIAVLGTSPQSAATQLKNVLTANNVKNLTYTGNVSRNCGENSIILGEKCYNFKIQDNTFSDSGAQVATGPYAAAIRIDDVTNYGTINDNSFDDASGSTAPYAVQGGDTSLISFENNFVRYNNAKVWEASVGKPSGSHQVYGSAGIVAAKIAAASAAWDAVASGTGMRQGLYQFWVDGAGKMRIKAGKPTSDTDGVIVGTQA